MCLNCGCCMPEESHGDPANITLPALTAAARASGLPVAEAAWNIPRTLAAAMSPEWPPGIAQVRDHPDVLFDCDGILAFTAEALVASLNAAFGTSYDALTQSFFPGRLDTGALVPEQGTFASDLFRDPAFLLAIAPDFRAFDAFSDARDAGIRVLVVTERAPETADATTRWLGEWGLPGCDVYAVGRGQKPAFIQARYNSGNPCILIDDNPAARMTVAGPGTEVWTPSRPYSPAGDRPYVRTFPSWQTARYWLGLTPAP